VDLRPELLPASQPRCDGDLIWNGHEGRGDGTFAWAAAEGRKVGNGWNPKRVFSGGQGIIYAELDSGGLIWNRHEGRGDGTFSWAIDVGGKVGTGWDALQLFRRRRIGALSRVPRSHCCCSAPIDNISIGAGCA
jgi:hypothetical protein